MLSSMNRLTRLLCATALTITPVMAVAAPADAAAKYSSCAKLTKVFPNGVAKSKAAANKQVRQGNSRPAHGKRAKKVYWKNYKSLDRDKDGTACEN